MSEAAERWDFVHASNSERATLAYLWAVEKHTLGDLARSVGIRDTWQIRCAIELFIDRHAPRWADEYRPLPELRAKVIEILAARNA